MFSKFTVYSFLAAVGLLEENSAWVCGMLNFNGYIKVL